MTDDGTERLLARAATELRRPGPRDAVALETTLFGLRQLAPGRSTATPIGRMRMRDVLSIPTRRRARGAGTWRFLAGLAAGLAFAAGLGVGLIAGWSMRGASIAAPGGAGVVRSVDLARGASSDAAFDRRVQFMLVAPSASRVALVGEFNDWDPTATPMVAAPGGVWHVALPLAQGRHLYAFVVDGTLWVTDPLAPLAAERWFGARNSVVLVGGGVGS